MTAMHALADVEGNAGQVDSRVGLLYRLLGNFVLALVVVGFPVAAAASQILGASSNSLNMLFRIGHVGLCLLLLLWTLQRGRVRLDYLILGFFALYAARLLLDYGYGNYPDIGANIQFAVVAVLIPTLAMANADEWFDQHLAAWMIVGIGTLGNIMTLYALRTDPLLLIRDQIYTGAEGRVSLSALNSISIGYNGLFTAAAAVILLTLRPQGWRLVALSGSAPLALYLMLQSGSRGPFVALVFAMIVTAFSGRRLALAYIAIAVAGLFVIAGTGVQDVLLNRVTTIGSDASSLERSYALQISAQLALEHPLFGFGYIEPTTGLYPHNLLVEAGLALGVLGFALMLWMQTSMVTGALDAARANSILLAFLAATQLANAWLSGSLWGSGLFFVALWLVRGRQMLRNVEA